MTVVKSISSMGLVSSSSLLVSSVEVSVVSVLAVLPSGAGVSSLESQAAMENTRVRASSRAISFFIILGSFLVSFPGIGSGGAALFLIG